jgi:hypothetical protein
VIDPALGGSTVNDIVADVGRSILTLLLPTLFDNDCNVNGSQRKLANAATGVKIGPAGPVEECKNNNMVCLAVPDCRTSLHSP